MRAFLLGSLTLAAMLTGCTVPRDATGAFVIQPDQYVEAFDTTRTLLRDCRFVPDRVDARAGVITTDPKHSAGVATPWDLEQSSPVDELADLGNYHSRRVRVTFIPVKPEGDTSADPLGAPIADVRQSSSPIEVRVQVFVDRTRIPGWRLNATGIWLSTNYRDASMLARGLEPRYTQPIRRDDDFAKRLAHMIAMRLAETEARNEG